MSNNTVTKQPRPIKPIEGRKWSKGETLGFPLIERMDIHNRLAIDPRPGIPHRQTLKHGMDWSFTDVTLITPVEGHRDWDTGLYSFCADGKTMWFSLLCAPCAVTDVAARTGDCACVPWLPGGLVALRARIRTLGGIKGSICDDCTAVYCCPLCAVCQMQRELEYMQL